MEDLKTIRDLEYKFEIKEEAIKWIKDIESKWEKRGRVDEILGCGSCFACYEGFGSRCEQRFLVNWIKHFFNISEDLK